MTLHARPETTILMTLNDLEAVTLCAVIETYRLLRDAAPGAVSDIERAALDKLERSLLTSGAFTREQYREVMVGLLSALKATLPPPGHSA